MSDIHIRREGHAGRITLNRPQALNALTYDMIRAIEAAFDNWRDDDKIALILIDAKGDKAFCAGGDIAEMYRTGMAGDYAYGQQFWRDEYRLNARIAAYPKPTVSFLQGFTMGGGVGIGCHCAHRVVNGNSVIAMPECSIGLVPDVGGSLILAHAPGHLGCYLGTTTTRLAGPDAIYAGFADHLIAPDQWETLKQDLIANGDPAILAKAADAHAADDCGMWMMRKWIDRHFGHTTLADILASLRAVTDDDPDDYVFATGALKALHRNSPLSMACTVEMLHRLRAPTTDINDALTFEYRFTARSMEHGDFLEGIRAAIIDKDRAPEWKHALDGVTRHQVAAMLAPLQQEFTS